MFNLDEREISSNIAIFELYAQQQNHDIAGIAINRYYGFFIQFEGIVEMFSILDRLFNYVNFPMASMEERSFISAHAQGVSRLPDEICSLEELEKTPTEPSFVLHVQFRMGTTWQGTLNWVGPNKIRQFRSEQELLQLLLSALDMERRLPV